MSGRVEQAIWRAGQFSLLIVVSVLPWFFGGVQMEQRAWLALALILPLVCAGLLWKRTASACSRLVLPFGVFAAASLLGTWQLSTISSDFNPAARALRSEFSADSKPDESEAPLSIHPPATRRDLAILIAAAASFALGAVFFADPKSLLLFMGALAANGAALSAWGLLERAAAKPWSYGGITAPMGAQPFGPFINRNSAGGYLCICFAAALGLVLWRVRKLLNRTITERYRGHASAWSVMLDTGVLALGTTSILIFAGIIGTLSRASVLAAVVGTVSAVLLLALTSRSTAYFWPMVVGGATALAFVLWLGPGESLVARWSQFAESGLEHETRPLLWREAFQSTKTYGFFGSGLGTFYYAHAPFQHHLSLGQYRYGENQFVEAVLVGGYFGASLLLVFGLRCLGAVRLLLRNAVSSAEFAIAFSGACLLLTQMICASFDFGWYLPAIFVPLSLWCGGLVRLSADSPSWTRKKIRRGRAPTPPFGSSTPVPGTAAMRSSEPATPVNPGSVTGSAPRGWASSMFSTTVLVALIAGSVWAFQITRVAMIVENADRFTRQYLQADAAPTIAEVDRAVEVQAAAVAAEPDNGEALIRLAELKGKRYELETGRSTLQLYSQVALAERIGNVAEIQRLRDDPPAQKLLRPALEECRRAGYACPFNYFVHLLTAQLCFLDKDPTSSEACLLRAERLAQGRPDWLYLLGAMHLDAARTDSAWRDWRRACELRPGLCDTVFPIALSFLGPAQSLQRVVPDNPNVIIEVARNHLSDRPSDERSPYYLKAIELIEEGGEQSPQSTYLLATALAELGKLEAAETAIAQALRDNQARGDWYFELACIQAALGKSTLADIAFARYELLTGYHGKTASAYKRRAADLLRNRDQDDADFWKQCGELYFSAGANAESLAAFRRAVARSPSDAAANAGLATALLAVGDPSGAVDAASKAVALDPHQPTWNTLLLRAKAAMAAIPK